MVVIADISTRRVGRASMSENDKADTARIADSETSEDTTKTTSPTKKRSKKMVVVIAILAVMVLAGGGAWVWHEQPSFCNAFCHTPMDEYYETYLATPGTSASDKYGNAVSDASSMLAATHREAGEGCLDCHVPTIGEMVSEGLAWIPGNYYFPLSERDLDDLTAARGIENDEFCLNSKCHHVGPDGSLITSREALYAATSGLAFNPHADFHGDFDCGTCHKAHRASVDVCARPGCHSDVTVPAGWLDYPESREIELYLADPE